MPQVPATLSPGTVIRGRYLVIDTLGKGGFSAVYLIQDQQRGGSVFALKEVVAFDKQARELFTFESSLLERLAHPALPRVYTVFDDEAHDRMYMLMDYVEGPDLETLRHIQPEKRFSVAVTTAILAPVVNAIEYLHQQCPPIIHRDIKTSNIIVPVVGGKIVLVDFGIAKVFDSDETTSAVRHATPGYAAPEHYAVGTNTRTDIYGLGATLFTLLTGEVPTDALERMMQLSNDQPDPLKPACELVPSIPLPLSRAIQRAMSINMAQRYATVKEFWQALQGEPGQKRTSEALEEIVVAPAASEVPVQRDEPPSRPLHEQKKRISEALKAKDVLPTTPEVSAQTVVPSSQPFQKQERQLPGSRASKRFQRALLLTVLLIVGSGASFWVFHALGSKPSPPSSVISAPSPVPGLNPASTATVLPHFPRLAKTYSGTFEDLQTSVSFPIALTQVRQHDDGRITGTFSTTQTPRGRAYTGLLDTSKHIYFTVANGTGNTLLYFTGEVQANGELTGTVCAIEQGGGECILGDVNGWWTLTPGNPAR